MTRTFDLEEFKLFVAGKPADERYDPNTARLCALGQFGIMATSCTIADQGIPDAVYDAAVFESPFSFGSLLSRLNNLPAAAATADDEGGGSVPLTPALTNDGGEDVR